jgi:methylenetetrahydrofolate dehydrogenase (NADP+)/methenyltetrahydrofolate cyclohydrolase
MSQLIDGKAYAAKLLAEIAAEVVTMSIKPGLAVVLVGDDPASQVYVRNKAKQTALAGMNSIEHRLDAATPEPELLALVQQLNEDASIHGILVQLPLPEQIDAAKVLDAISPDKDVDGFHIINAGRLAVGLPGLVPCTPLGCVMLAKSVLGDLAGLNAVVVGRSNIVGKPVAQLLLRENCTVTIAHSRSTDLPEICRGADVLIAAVGRPEMIRGDWIKPGATVIDVGINRIPPDGNKTRLVGDVAFAEAALVAAHITPVPGGVGPMTIACLLRNTLTAAKRTLSLP